MGYKINKIRVGTNLVRPVGRLPSGYQEVEYIQSSGTQYIDTGLKPTPNHKVEAKYQLVDLTKNYNTIFGLRNGEIRFAFRFRKSDSSYDFQRSVSKTSNAEYSSDFTGAYDTNIHIASLSRYGYMDGTLKWTGSSSSETGTYAYNLYLFAGNEGGTGVYDNGVIKLYYCKIWDNNNNLVRDFVPCYRISDGVIGLYDLVNNQFYTNSGSGTFTKGPDVN